jgi:hypothetical protein
MTTFRLVTAKLPKNNNTDNKPQTPDRRQEIPETSFSKVHQAIQNTNPANKIPSKILKAHTGHNT